MSGEQTSARLDELDALREAATPGPWRLAEADRGEPYPGLLAYGPDYELLVDFSTEVETEDESVCRADAALIVAAVNALPGLVAAVRGVLDLHQPDEYGTCAACFTGYQDGTCDTSRAIAAALAAGRPDEERDGRDICPHGHGPDDIARQRSLGWPDFHPEDYCHRCGRPNPTWFADTAEWQTATGSTGDGGGILCPSCFCALWESVTGRTAIIWRLSIDPRSRDAGPTGEGRAEPREHYPCCGLGPECHRYGLCALEQREAAERGELAALRALRQRVEAVAARFETARIDDPIAAWVGRTFAEHLRRALAGRDGDGETGERQ